LNPVALIYGSDLAECETDDTLRKKRCEELSRWTKTPTSHWRKWRISVFRAMSIRFSNTDGEYWHQAGRQDKW